MFQRLEETLERVVNPIAAKINENQSLQAISAGFVKMMPITMGVAVLMILGNLPFQAWTDWLTEVGVKSDLDAVLNASTSAIALFVSYTIAHSFAEKRKQKGVNAGLISLSGFLLLTPQVVGEGEAATSAFALSHLGSSGIVIAVIVSLIVGHMYCWLSEKGFAIKLPSSVPSMVADSLSPVFVSMAIYVVLFALRVAFHFTPYGDMHAFVTAIISAPLMSIGSSVPALLLVLFVSNVFWFFGIHPSTIQGPFGTVLLTMLYDNIEKFSAGEPMTYIVPCTVYLIASAGANGNTLGLIIDMLTAKSERYKAMLKLGGIPHIFNINEPIIFGMPMILNATFFIPMTVNCVISGLIAWAYLSVVPTAINPLMGLLPWTTPFPVLYFFEGGVPLLALALIIIAVNAVVYYPFFRIADNKALAEEAAQHESEAKTAQV